MEFIKKLSFITKTVFSTGLIITIYGYLCREIGLYFFWESKSIGWILLFIGVIGLLSDRIKLKKNEKKNTVFEKIMIGVIIFILFIQTILISVIPFTDAFTTTKTYLMNNEKLKLEIGNIIGFGLIPAGSFQKTIDSSGEYGNASISLTVKGDRKYIDITVYVVKETNNPVWKVTEIY